tara:strand:- start:8651 stop:9379 length:729 start_codon:yes stop_codon:yes gene_type:complete
MYKLLTVGGNPKLIKGDKIQDKYLNAVMHFRPISSKICPFQIKAGCKEACLNTAGRGGIFKKGENTNRIQDARQRRTDMFLNDYDNFMALLIIEITKFSNYCYKKDRMPCVRLNGTSDIQWEYKIHNEKNIFEHFPNVQFYDYTKIPTRKTAHIKNYHLTWSYSEANKSYSDWFDKIAHNIAVVFSGEMPLLFKGLKVISGDTHDMRFLDEPNVVIGLKAKGKAKKDLSGFVIHNNNIIATS